MIGNRDYETAFGATEYKLAVMEGLLHCMDDLVSDHYTEAGPHNCALSALVITLREMQSDLLKLHGAE